MNPLRLTLPLRATARAAQRRGRRWNCAGFPLLAAVLAGVPAAHADGVRHGPRTVVTAETADAGGGLSTSPKYRNLGSVSSPGGTSAGLRATAQHGYPAQIDRVSVLPTTPGTRVLATCRSLMLRPFAGLIQNQWHTNYVTTFDGTSARPNTTVFSQESRPRAGEPGVYEADFVTYDPAGVAWQYGTFITVAPPADDDRNTLPDVMQWDRPGDGPVSGQSLPDWPPTVPPGTSHGQLHRPAGSASGHYELTVQNTFGTVEYAGEFSLVYFACQAAYVRGATNQLRLSPPSGASGGFTRLVGGECAFTVVSPDEVQLAAFSLRRGDGTVHAVLPTRLVRSGRTYVGSMTLVDGGPETPWPDFTQWVIELTDEQDGNENGIPDFSDAAAPPPDGDGDGMPDDFELAHGLDPRDPADAVLDPDGDGATNGQEYAAGTLPRDPASVLRLEVEVRDARCHLAFTSRPDRTYRLERRPDLATGAWEPVVPPVLAGTGERLTITDPDGLRQERYYRLRVSPGPP